MKPFERFRQSRFEHHMDWHDLYQRQARTARSQIEYARRNKIRLDPKILDVAADAERLAEKAWNAAQRWT